MWLQQDTTPIFTPLKNPNPDVDKESGYDDEVKESDDNNNKNKKVKPSEVDTP